MSERIYEVVPGVFVDLQSVIAVTNVTPVAQVQRAIGFNVLLATTITPLTIAELVENEVVAEARMAQLTEAKDKLVAAWREYAAPQMAAPGEEVEPLPPLHWRCSECGVANHRLRDDCRTPNCDGTKDAATEKNFPQE